MDSKLNKEHYKYCQLQEISVWKAKYKKQVFFTRGMNNFGRHCI